MRVGEAHPFPRELPHARGRHLGVVVVSLHVAVAEVIAQDYHYVRTLGFCAKRGGGGHQS